MNDYILILKGDNKNLARFEFEILWEIYFGEKILLEEVKNVIYKFSSKVLVEGSHTIFSRLTYTNILIKKLGSYSGIEDFKKNAPNLLKYDSKSFLVRVRKSRKAFKQGITERDLAAAVWSRLDNPRVDIKNPDIEFNFVFLEDEVKFFFGVKLYENKKDYKNRMPKKRPVSAPYTLKSDMARAAINLLGLKEGLVLDPFCGIGGILLEAYDMGFDVIGNDISWNDLKYFKENFEYYYPGSRYIRTLADSSTQFLKEDIVDGIVTDIPYGKCSRKLGVELYENFLINAKKYLKKNHRLIVIYSNHTHFKPLATKHFKEIVEIEEYINRDMTRFVLILENDK